MPEGHVIHGLAHALNERFAGKHVRVSSPQGRWAQQAARFDGAVFEGASAYGKELILQFDRPEEISIHLGLIGSFNLNWQAAPLRWAGAPQGYSGKRGTGVPLWAGEGPQALTVPGRIEVVQSAHTIATPAGKLETIRLRLALEEAGELYCADLRGPQWCRAQPRPENGKNCREGADPLAAEIDSAQVAAVLAKAGKSRRSVGALLMDQKLFPGVGNIYRAEVLFRNGINPETPGAQLSANSWRALWTDLVVTMREGLVRGSIDTVLPEHTPARMGREPRVDDHGGEVYVYRRAGKACHQCGEKILTRVMQGRNLFWCPQCQQPSGKYQ